MACYNLDGAKALKLFELDCQEAAATSGLLLNKVGQLTIESVERGKVAAACESQRMALTTLNNSGEDLIKRLSNELKEEQAWSLRADALWPVVLGAVLLTLAAGAGGFALSEKLH